MQARRCEAFGRDRAVCDGLADAFRDGLLPRVAAFAMVLASCAKRRSFLQETMSARRVVAPDGRRLPPRWSRLRATAILRLAAPLAG